MLQMLCNCVHCTEMRHVGAVVTGVVGYTRLDMQYSCTSKPSLKDNPRFTGHFVLSYHPDLEEINK